MISNSPYFTRFGNPYNHFASVAHNRWIQSQVNAQNEGLATAQTQISSIPKKIQSGVSSALTTGVTAALKPLIVPVALGLAVLATVVIVAKEAKRRLA